jgi:hypothetical protein
MGNIAGGPGMKGSHVLRSNGVGRKGPYVASYRPLLQTTQPLSSAQLEFKDEPEWWSISEIVEHLTIVHNLVF